MVRSMCCRLQLDLRDLLKRGNGLFGSAEQTGSIGVVTLNCARLGHLHAGDEDALFARMDQLLELARTAWRSSARSFSGIWTMACSPTPGDIWARCATISRTIGVNGINEMIRNFSADAYDISETEGQALAGGFSTTCQALVFQEETGHIYNLEATPAEGTTYRFAKEDRKRFPGILQAGTAEQPYYTNRPSCRWATPMIP